MHNLYMTEALTLAKFAASRGEIPVGCVVVDCTGNIIGRGFNMRQTKKCSTAHAEILAIEDACRTVGDWRLSGAALYVTLEPCPMCAGAVILSRIETVVYGAREPHTGSCGSVLNLFMEDYEHSVKVFGGVLEKECADILSDFFRELR